MRVRVSQTCTIPLLPPEARRVPSGDQASAYTSPKRFSAAARRVLLFVFHTWMMPFLPPVARSVPLGDHASAYTRLTGPRAIGGEAAEEATVLLPHAVKVKLRNKRRLSVKPKKDIDLLMSVSPVDRSNCCTN